MSTVGLSELVRVFGRIGVLSFGGPAAQIALMHREVVEKRPWLSESAFLRAISLCMLLPGPEAMQLATYTGWRLNGLRGGLIAGGLFVLPGAMVIFTLALGYVYLGQQPIVQAAFLGVQAAVIIVVLQALFRLSRKALEGVQAWALALLSFIALFVFGVPFPALILIAGLWGAVALVPEAEEAVIAPLRAADSFRTILIWCAIWAAPLLVLWAVDADFLLELGLFFSKLAVVTFGGAYAVLAYMTQEVVQDYGWISTSEMIDALGLAETTPGPLILVTQFVAVLAGFAQGGVMQAIAAGLLALWVTFTPCFLWIFLAGPFVDRLSSQPRLAGALRGITGAVVGVIANLSVWFALHVLFGEVGEAAVFALPAPVVSTFDVAAAGLVGLAALLMLGRSWGIVRTMLVLGAAGVSVSFI